MLLILLGGYFPASAITLAEAVDQPALTFDPATDADWQAQTSVSHDGVDAAQSGPIDNNQSSSLSIAVDGNARISFRWKVSSESGYDFLRFYIDGNEQLGSLSGEMNWQSRTYDIRGPGTHTLKWSYIKDRSVSGGADAAWLDELAIVPELPSTLPEISGPEPVSILRNESAVLQIDATDADFFQWYRGARGDTNHPVTGATSRVLVTPPLIVDSTFWVRVGNNVGTVDSSSANVTINPVQSGGLYAMGSSADGQLGIGILKGTPLAVDLTGISRVAAGFHHSLLLKADGTLWAVGDNQWGQLGDGSTFSRSLPVQVASDVAEIAAGKYHSLFIKTDGSLWATGLNFSGQLGDASDSYLKRSTPVQVASGVAAVAAGNKHSLFIKTDGTLWATGDNSSGQLGDGSSQNRSTPVQIASAVASVAAGDAHSLFVKTDGSLWAMGDNGSGQLGDGSSENRSTPVQVASDVARVSAGHLHTLFVKTDGSLWAMGLNASGQLGDGTSVDRLAPVQIASGVAEIAAGVYHSLFVKTDGSLWAMGFNLYSQLGDGTTTNQLTPVQIDGSVSRVAAGFVHSLFVKTDGSLRAMGDNDYGQLGVAPAALDTTRRTPVLIAADVLQTATGFSHSLFIKADGSLWAMGLNDQGQLGDGTLYKRALAVPIASDAAGVAAGSAHSLFIKTDGSLWAMGDNGSGQLGDGTFQNRATPVQVASDVTRVAAGGSHSLFIKTDGSLWAMGLNSSGQLGDGSTQNLAIPVQIASDVVQVAAGGSHSLFIKTDGSLWAMGLNSSGQLGDPAAATTRHTPVQVASGVAKVAAGYAHSLFINANGELCGMGDDNEGQLGKNSFGNLSLPAYIASGVIRVAAGAWHSLFIKTDGSLWAMGNNYYGQLGSDSAGRIPREVASRIGGPLAAGGRHGLFIRVPTHTVTFDLGSHGRAFGAGAQTVIEGRSAIAPKLITTPPDWVFRGWHTGFNNITGDLVVQALYLRTQTINFAPPAIQTFKPAGPNTLTLSPTSGSGLPVVLEVISGPASLGEDGRTLAWTDGGTILLRASQPGDDTWAAAPSVEQRVVVQGPGKPQKIAFAAASPTYGDPAFRLSVNASSGLPVSLELISGPALLDGDILTVTDVGPVVIKASQPGGSGFAAAANVVRTFLVKKARLTVRADNVSRLIGDPNPAFTITYSGFVGWDAFDEYGAIDALDRRPTATTKADVRSAEGVYAITISGGSDKHYEFHPAAPAGTLTVRGLGGSYEALLVGNDFNLIGKLALDIPVKGFSYTGVLTLASEPKPLVVSSASPTAGLFVPSRDGIKNGTSAKTAWTHAGTGYSLDIEVSDEGEFVGSLTRDSDPVGTLAHGSRLYKPVARTSFPGSGQHTLTLYPGAPLDDDSDPGPAGFGHASGSIHSASGILKLAGRLADGATLTASLKPSATGDYLLWTNPYGSRTHSFLAGRLADDPELLFLTWKKAALPDSTPAAKRDKSHRAGFGPAALPFALEAWLPPVAKATPTKPAVTLVQSLGLASSGNAAELDLDYGPADLSLGASASALPAFATLSTAGKLAAKSPTTSNWQIHSLNPATGAFTGSFVLIDPTPTTAKPDKTTKRSVPFFGILRQRATNDPDDMLVGAGSFLLPALPGSESDEQVSGEFRLTAP